MKSHYKIENPENIEATIVITMSVGEWEKLREQLDNEWPAWKLSSAIRQMLLDARAKIYPTEGKDAE